MITTGNIVEQSYSTCWNISEHPQCFGKCPLDFPTSAAPGARCMHDQTVREKKKGSHFGEGPLCASASWSLASEQRRSVRSAFSHGLPRCPMDAWCTPGKRVEVILCEEGLAGSRYAARVIEVDKGRAFVEFEVRRSSSARQLEGRTETVATPHRRSTRKAQRKPCCVSGTRRTIFSQSLHRLPKAFLRCGSRRHSHVHVR